MSQSEALDWIAIIEQAQSQMQNASSRRERRQAEREQRKIDKKVSKKMSSDEDFGLQIISQSIPLKESSEFSVIPEDRVGCAVIGYATMFFTICMIDATIEYPFSRLPSEERDRISEKFGKVFDLEWCLEHLDDKHFLSGGHDTKTVLDYIGYISKPLQKRVSETVMNFLSSPVWTNGQTHVPFRFQLKTYLDILPTGATGTALPFVRKDSYYAVVLDDLRTGHDCNLREVEHEFKNGLYWVHKSKMQRIAKPYPHKSFPKVLDKPF